FGALRRQLFQLCSQLGILGLKLIEALALRTLLDERHSLVAPMTQAKTNVKIRIGQGGKFLDRRYFVALHTIDNLAWKALPVAKQRAGSPCLTILEEGRVFAGKPLAKSVVDRQDWRREFIAGNRKARALDGEGVNRLAALVLDFLVLDEEMHPNAAVLP